MPKFDSDMKFTRRKTLYIVIIFFCIGISVFLAWQKFMIVHEPKRDISFYKFELDSIQDQRALLFKDRAKMNRVGNVFVKSMTDKIFPYWYGTKWDFNGTTKIPQEGSIACGYFVTTTLQHAGVKINRVKMAQCASEEMIRSLVSKNNIHHLSGISLKDFETKLKSYGNGLYVIGLDNHTGYVLLSEKGNYFIHASGWFPFKVVRDKLSESTVIAKSAYRVVGKLSGDEGFLRKWTATNYRQI